MIDIDYRKSILKSRIVFKEDLIDKFGWAFTVFILIGVMVFAIYIIIYQFNIHEKSTNNVSVALLLLTIVLGILTVVIKNLFMMTKVKSVKGIDSKVNREISTKILKELEVDIVVNRKDYLIGIVRNAMTSWGHQITLLYENEQVHINSITFDRFGGKSPFNIWSDGINVNSFHEKFNEEIKKHSTNSVYS